MLLTHPVLAKHHRLALSPCQLDSINDDVHGVVHRDASPTTKMILWNKPLSFRGVADSSCEYCLVELA
jgi:hypothetical protein